MKYDFEQEIEIKDNSIRYKDGQKLSNEDMKLKVWLDCESIGFWNISPSIYAKLLGTAHQNVSRWKNQWLNKHGKVNIDRIFKIHNVTYETALRETVRLMKHKSEKIRLKAIAAFADTQSKFIKFLESFGKKDKVANPLELSGDLKVVETISFEEHTPINPDDKDNNPEDRLDSNEETETSSRYSKR